MLYEKELKLNIETGCSKMDLITAFAYAYDKHNVCFARFNVVLTHPDDEVQKTSFSCLRKDHRMGQLAVRITELEYKDGSGESFMFQGYTPVSCTSVKGYYSTKSRTGWIHAAITLADDRREPQDHISSEAPTRCKEVAYVGKKSDCSSTTPVTH